MKQKDGKYHYLLDLADTYGQEIHKLERLQQINPNEFRQSTIDRLLEKWHEILADYEKFSLKDKGD